ncbi:hypothetical protein Bpla01_27040 [Burkholderia plantarii]|nr:hypothetical protein Bpla01_27040 [Burkholderia plantarii]
MRRAPMARLAAKVKESPRRAQPSDCEMLISAARVPDRPRARWHDATPATHTMSAAARLRPGDVRMPGGGAARNTGPCRRAVQSSTRGFRSKQVSTGRK